MNLKDLPGNARLDFYGEIAIVTRVIDDINLVMKRPSSKGKERVSFSSQFYSRPWYRALEIDEKIIIIETVIP